MSFGLMDAPAFSHLGMFCFVQYQRSSVYKFVNKSSIYNDNFKNSYKYLNIHNIKTLCEVL